MKIFIGGAWPYANGSLHLGHAAALLPGDVLARYHRLKGDQVLYVSGSDCHGTPISIRANQEGVSPRDISSRYHKEFGECFKKLGFSYDFYTRTDQEFHHKIVQDIFLKLYDKGIIYEKSIEQTYCEKCNQFLPDRYIEGICPHCGQPARGDQCDSCSSILDPVDLLDKKCKLCGSAPVFRETRHLFLDLPRFQKDLENYVDNSEGWRENAVALTRRYLKEGLKERAATRDLNWGVSVPIDGFEDKKVYVWIEAVSGYLSASKLWAKENEASFEKFWDEDVKSYYVHGKDNIPFHTLILPALLMGLGGLKLPDKIISSEYLTIEGKKISTSRNFAIWLPYIIERYNADSIRYFLISNGPEKRDADFSWREFIYKHNGELLGVFGNFVNRSLTFVSKYFDSKVPNGTIDENIKNQISSVYNNSGRKIEDGQFKNAIDEIFSLARYANKYFDDRQPWIQIKNNESECADTLYNCIQIIANLSNLLEPFIPFSCDEIRSFLKIDKPQWGYIELKKGSDIDKCKLLFERIDKKVIEDEVKKLKL